MLIRMAPPSRLGAALVLVALVLVALPFVALVLVALDLVLNVVMSVALSQSRYVSRIMSVAISNKTKTPIVELLLISLL
jgi:hypothetical protein